MKYGIFLLQTARSITLTKSGIAAPFHAEFYYAASHALNNKKKHIGINEINIINFFLKLLSPNAYFV